MLEKLKNMTYAEVKKICLSDGEYLRYFDAWKHLSAGFDDDNPEIFHGISNGKRNTERQASLYDAMLAEIMDDRNAEKAKVRNRRKADRKHNVLPNVRKQMRYDRDWNRYLSMPCYGCKNIGIAEYRMDNAESVARADWEIESAEIAEEEEWERFNRELEEFDRKWREQAEAEQRKMREYRKMVELNEWLKWA